MQTRRQRTRQDAQRAKVKARRRYRGPADEKQHGERSQSGVKIRSKAAWKAWLAGPAQAAVNEAARVDQLVAGWRQREAEKAAKR